MLVLPSKRIPKAEVSERLSKAPFKLPATEEIVWVEIFSGENDQSWRGSVPFAQRLKYRKKQNKNAAPETECFVKLSLMPDDL
jgi:hypothetical protein